MSLNNDGICSRHITFRINMEMHAAQWIMRWNILVKPCDTMKPISLACIDETRQGRSFLDLYQFWMIGPRHIAVQYDTATQIWTVLFWLELHSTNITPSPCGRVGPRNRHVIYENLIMTKYPSQTTPEGVNSTASDAAGDEIFLKATSAHSAYEVHF